MKRGGGRETPLSKGIKRYWEESKVGRDASSEKDEDACNTIASQTVLRQRYEEQGATIQDLQRHTEDKWFE